MNEFCCEIDLVEPKTRDEIFHPYICFRLVQKNMTGHLMHEGEIDGRIDLLKKEMEKVRKKLKKEFREAMRRHDRLLGE